jgi:hypothetical protein
MVDLALFVESGHRFGPGLLGPAGMDDGDGDVLPDSLDGVPHHLTALVALGDDPVRPEPVIGFHDLSAPLPGRHASGIVRQHIAAAIDAEAGDDDPGKGRLAA